MTVVLAVGMFAVGILTGPAAVAAPLHLTDTSPFDVSDNQQALQIMAFVIVGLSLASALGSIPIVLHARRKNRRQGRRSRLQQRSDPVRRP